MNPYFSFTDKLYDVTEQYPVLLDFLCNQGFEMLKNDAMRATLGKTITLEHALKSRQLDPAVLEAEMVHMIEETQKKSSDEIHIHGVLPCPIRLQILEKLDAWIAGQDQKVVYDLQAASMGLDRMKEQIEKAKSADDLADVYLSAGFSLFFDREIMGTYLDNHVFSDQSGFTRFQEAFDNKEISLRDPKGQYTIIGVVPAIFMVNKEVLGDRKVPRSWKDLFDPELEGMVAVPMQDMDLANALLLGIYSRYGMEGVQALGRNMHGSMHPAQMVKEGSRKKKAGIPAITVMPYFFTWMAKEGGPMEAVWPEDGAIVSPIFLMTKEASKEKIKGLTKFLCSEEMSSILSADGKFPSTHPQADNGLTPEQKFLWPGWEFIYQHDIGNLLKETEEAFLKAYEEKKLQENDSDEKREGTEA